MRTLKREWLLNARKSAGLTQQQTAREAGISANHYCNIENGVRGSRISAKVAKNIAQTLKIDWTKFYE